MNEEFALGHEESSVGEDNSAEINPTRHSCHSCNTKIGSKAFSQVPFDVLSRVGDEMKPNPDHFVVRERGKPREGKHTQVIQRARDWSVRWFLTHLVKPTPNQKRDIIQELQALLHEGGGAYANQCGECAHWLMTNHESAAGISEERKLLLQLLGKQVQNAFEARPRRPQFVVDG